MTAPDVAALAAALTTARSGGQIVPPSLRATFGLPPIDEVEAEAIIAALAAQGWRITSAPEWTTARERRDHETADDPARAQGAPDPIDIEVRQPVGAVLSVRVPGPLAVAVDREARALGVTMSEVIRRAIEARHGPWTGGNAVTLDVSAIEQAAVRAALDAATERVAALAETHGYSTGHGRYVWAQSAIAAIRDARLGR